MERKTTGNYIGSNNSRHGLCTQTRIYGLENSLRVSGFPMQTEDVFEAPERALKRGSHLGGTIIGEGHDNFLLGIIVQFDLAFTNKAWTELQRYHFIDIVSSQSTMHRLLKFDLDKCYNRYVRPKAIENMKEIKAEYDAAAQLLKDVSQGLVQMSEKDLDTVKENMKELYLEALYSNPAGMILKSGMTTNYRQLKTIVVQRWNHRLPEWREFTEWCFRLPHFAELTGLDEEKFTAK